MILEQAIAIHYKEFPHPEIIPFSANSDSITLSCCEYGFEYDDPSQEQFELFVKQEENRFFAYNLVKDNNIDKDKCFVYKKPTIICRSQEEADILNKKNPYYDYI